MESRRNRRGFTLVELLVVIAIIGVLVALLLPAVQAAREAARRAQCTNNLKQIGLAMHNHHDTYGELPVGMAGSLSNNGANRGGWGWAWGVYILPFMERDNLYDTVDNRIFSDSGWMGNNPEIDAAVRADIDAFVCPSSANPKIQGNQATHNYAGNAGSNWTSGDDSANTWNTNGVFRFGNPRNDGLRFSDITDGTSSTLMVAEKTGIDKASPQCNWCSCNAIFSSHMDSGAGTNEASEHVGSTRWAFNSRDERAFHSFHPGGINGVLVDGSVRFFPETTNQTIRNRIGARNDGQVAELP